MSRETLYVTDGEQRVPFLRGILTHSLLKRGLSFGEAYETADLVRAEIRPRGQVERAELVEIINDVISRRFGPETAHRLTRPAAPEPVTVFRGDDRAPFSKGMLSQSLQATGLEPALCHEIAREIESVLVSESDREVSRDGLRKLIYETICESYDAQVADNYLLWRYLRAPDRPVVILCGGATGVGKSSVAAELAHRLGIGSIVSTDTIREIMRMMLSEDLLPAIHYSSYEAWRGRSSGENPPDELVLSGFVDQSARVAVGVAAMVQRAAQENSRVVIDGVHLVPGILDLQSLQQKSYLAPILLTARRRKPHRKRFAARQQVERLRPATRYEENLDSIRTIQDFLVAQAEAHSVPCIDNDDLDQAVLTALHVITDTLREQVGLTVEQLKTEVLGS